MTDEKRSLPVVLIGFLSGLVLVLVIGGFMMLTGGDGDAGALDFSSLDPVEAINGFSTEEERIDVSFAALNSFYGPRAHELRDAALANLGSADPDVRFAAVYGFTLTADISDLDSLRSLLLSTDVLERAMAAEALLYLGDPGGFPPLIDALNSSESVWFLHRPQPVWEIARLLLMDYAQQDLGLLDATDAASAAAARSTWETWWQENRDTLRFDASVGAFVSEP